MNKRILAISTVILTAISGFAQQTPVKWEAKLEPSKSFIENRTQFDNGDKLSESNILFAVDHGAQHIYFTSTGLTYQFDTFERIYPPKAERTAEDEAALAGLNHVQKEREEKRLSVTTDVVHMKWANANANIEVVGLEKTHDHHNYSLGEKGSIDNVPAFRKLIYKNVYSKIDVEYVFHPEGGIKYSFILHPGADASQIEMEYSSAEGMHIDASGNVHFPTISGDIIEHAPVTFYSDNETEIASRFMLDETTLKLQLADYDISRKVILDPWVQTPTLDDSNGVWECESDAAGNVYIIGGESPLTLQKYSSIGALQWTYSTPYDTLSGDWLGTLATDDVGNSYVSNGASAALQKVNTGGNQQWSVTGGFSDEYWTISFNCDQTKLVIGGTINLLDAGIFDISTITGGVLNTIAVASFGSGGGFNPEEVRSLSPSKNSRYYFLTHSFIGAIDENFSPCFNGDPIFVENSGYQLSYKCENYRPNNGNAGIKAIRANEDFVYTVNGTDIQKRSLFDGAILATASIPGGGSTLEPFFGTNQIENAGIDIDDCGNVYVGSGGAVHKYSTDLNLISSISTDFTVYDVEVSTNGDVIVAGSTGDQSTINRTGYVQSFSMSACNALELICCDPNICPIDSMCEDDVPTVLMAGSAGGTWSGTGITDPSTGAFDPAIAGAGAHTVLYTLSCGADSVIVIVGTCQPLEVCQELNGDLTVLNGVGPFTWQQEETTEDCSACFPPIPPFVEPCSTPPGCAVLVTGWVTFTTGVTATPTTYPIRVTDSGGDELVIVDASALPPCFICNLPTISSTYLAPTCAGGNNGSIDLTITANSPYDVLWDNSETTEDISNLTAGTYIVTVTDEDTVACFLTETVTIEDGQAPSIDNTVIVGASCGGSDGSLEITATGADMPFVYSIDNGVTFQVGNMFTGLAVGPYDVVVEDANGCQSTQMVTVTNLDAPVLDNVVAVDPTCGATDGTIDITASGGTAPLQYSIDNGVTFQASGSFGSLAGGTYDIVVEDAVGCLLTDQVVLNTTTDPIIDNVEITDPQCAGSDGQILITASGGTAPFNYSIDNGVTTQTTATFAGIEAGTFDIVVIDDAGCQSTQTITVNTDELPTITDATTVDLTCNLGCNGSLDIDATGGTAPYQYSLDGNSFQASEVLNAVCAANYNVVVQDANGCEATFNITVGTEPYVDVNAIDFNASVVCADDEIEFTAQITDGLPPFSIDWSTGDTGETVTVAPSVTTTYQFNVEDDCGKTDVGNVEVTVSTYQVLLDGIPDSIICELDEINLYVSAMGGALEQYTFNWTGQDIVSGSATPNAYVVSTISVEGGENEVLIYSVDVTDHCGNTVSRTVELMVQDCDLFVPNVFTPGGDEVNDNLVVANLDKHPNSSMEIYNRWGLQIYESDNYLNDWDGDGHSSGVYYYVLTPVDGDALTGFVHLLGND